MSQKLNLDMDDIDVIDLQKADIVLKGIKRVGIVFNFTFSEREYIRISLANEKKYKF